MPVKREFVALFAVVVLLFVMGAISVQAQIARQPNDQITNNQNNLRERVFFFSIEEEFVTQGPEPADGNPIISDGDLLTSNGMVYMRNAELLSVFKGEFDLGLDAVHVLDVQDRIVAFSTSLDDPNGQFTAGDLLFTNGAVIPNAALLANFDLPRLLDLGLDAVHFIGTREQIFGFLDNIQNFGRDRFLGDPTLLSQFLQEFQIDIWFSTEGTGPNRQQPVFLDGDLLSVLNGVVLKNENALPASVPAGIPSRGVDFGMDAYTRALISTGADLGNGLFSTEINGKLPSFTDGDVMLEGVGAIVSNLSLIGAFEPRVRDMGLDALWVFEPDDVTFNRCRFTKIGGLVVDSSIWDFAAGYVDPNNSGRKDHAFGRWVSIRGELTDAAVQHRVLVRPDGAPLTDADPILMPSSLNWRVFCHPFSSWVNVDITGDGWMSSNYWKFLRDNCLNGDLMLVNFNSNSVSDGKYILTLQIRDASGNIITCQNVPIQVDNTRPEITVPDTHECNEYVAADMPLDIEGAFRDINSHFWLYRLTLHSFYWGGGVPIDSRFYFQGAPLSSDGTPSYPAPAALTTLDISSLLTSHFGNDFEVPDGRYTIRYRAWDRTLLGRFTPFTNAVGDLADRNEAIQRITNFEFTP